MRKVFVTAFFIILLSGINPSLAEQADRPDLTVAPKSEPLLTISGNIKVQNTENGALELDRALLESLPATSFTTRTPWTSGSSKFTGVALGDLLEAIGASSQRFEAVAVDDYLITIEGIDFDRYPVIIAYQLDDKPMTLRDLGPLWIMFPFDDHPELDTELNKAFCVWQLREMEIL